MCTRLWCPGPESNLLEKTQKMRDLCGMRKKFFQNPVFCVFGIFFGVASAQRLVPATPLKQPSPSFPFALSAPKKLPNGGA